MSPLGLAGYVVSAFPLTYQLPSFRFLHYFWIKEGCPCFQCDYQVRTSFQLCLWFGGENGKVLVSGKWASWSGSVHFFGLVCVSTVLWRKNLEALASRWTVSKPPSLVRGSWPSLATSNIFPGTQAFFFTLVWTSDPRNGGSRGGEDKGKNKTIIMSLTVQTIPPSPKDDPLWNNTWLSQLTSLQELHGVDDGVVSIYAEGHQDVGRGIEQHNLDTEMRGGVWLQEARDGTSWKEQHFVLFRNLSTEPWEGWGLGWGEEWLTPCSRKQFAVLGAEVCVVSDRWESFQLSLAHSFTGLLGDSTFQDQYFFRHLHGTFVIDF